MPQGLADEVGGGAVKLVRRLEDVAVAQGPCPELEGGRPRGPPFVRVFGRRA